MPNSTFFNLTQEKQKIIISAAIDEFSSQSYDSTSVNIICKNAGIPKGSFYQYFQDKLDLYLYLIEIATEEKLKVFKDDLQLSHEMTLIDQIRHLFIVGIEFGDTYPKLASLGERFLVETNDLVREKVLKISEMHTEDFYNDWIESAKKLGQVKPNISVKSLSLMIETLTQSILSTQIKYYHLHGKSLPKEKIIHLADELLEILSFGINP